MHGMGDVAIRAAVAQQQKPVCGSGKSAKASSSGQAAVARSAAYWWQKAGPPIAAQASQVGAGGRAGEDDLGLCRLDSGGRSGESQQGARDLAAGARKNHIIQIPETEIEGT